MSDTRQCPECDDIIKLPAGTMVGEHFACPSCGETYELDLELNLKKVESVAEDWGE